MRDPYQVLGVDSKASAAEIKSAYRKLAKKLHPDVNPGRKDIEQKFKETTAAYELLSDTTKRGRYDRGEIDAAGNEKVYARAQQNAYSSAAGGRSGRARSSNWGGRGGTAFSDFNAEDIFAEFFGGAQRNKAYEQEAHQAMRGEDSFYSLTVSFQESCLGGKRRVTLMNRKTIEVSVPPGTLSGDKLRLRGQGLPGPTGECGDAIIEIQVEPHAFFTREKLDIHLELPISLQEALLGAQITVPTLTGQVTVKVPKGANSGTTLRLKGKGITKNPTEIGDMYVKLKIVLPELPDTDLNEFIEKWAKKHGYDPRKKLGW